MILRPPVKLDDLIDEWTKDAVIDKTEPHKALERLPKLHAKYQAIRSHHNMIVKKIEFDYTEMKRWKTAYYSGEMNNPEDLEKYNLEPYPHKHGRNVESVVNADKDLIELLMKKTIHKEIVDYCEAVLHQIGNLHYSLGAIIKWRIFTNDTTYSED